MEVTYMKRLIENNFSRVLDLQGNNYLGYDSHFNIQDLLITVLLLTVDAVKYAYNSRFSGSTNWLYGLSEDGCNVAIAQNMPLKTGISSPLNLAPAKFSTHMIIKSSSSNVDLKTFDKIEFRGGVIDLLFPPDKIIKWDNESLRFVDRKIYTSSFNTEIDDENVTVIFSVDTSDLSDELGKLPDFREHIHSVVQFEFEDSRTLDKIEKYYSYALALCQFCVKQINVSFEMRLFKNETFEGKQIVNPSPILIKYYDGFDDYAQDRLNIGNIITFNMFKDKMATLLKILTEEDSRPILSFLPKSNQEIGKIPYFNVVDVCVAFEKEFSLHSDVLRVVENSIILEANNLHKQLKNMIKNSAYYVKVKEKAFNLIGQLKDYKPSIAEKIYALYDKFESGIRKITEVDGHDKLGISKFFTSDEFKDRVKQFVRMRGNAAHGNIVWNEGVEIYVYLELLLRSGFNVDESVDVLSWLFQRYF